MHSNPFHHCFCGRWVLGTKNHFPTNPGFKGKSERENTAVRLNLPFAITEVFELKMQVQFFLKATIILPAEEDQSQRLLRNHDKDLKTANMTFM